MTNQANISNNAASEVGKQAIAKWSARDKNGAQGDALGLKAILIAYETMTFDAVWKEKEDGKERGHHLHFDMKDYMTKQCTNANGTRNNKATQARTLAIFEKVFGVVNPTPAQSTSLRRCVDMARNFLALGYTAKDINITSRGYLEVPYVLMHDEPDPEKASERDLKTWAKNKDDTEVLDGTNGMSIAKFAQRIAPKTQRASQQPAAGVDQAATLVASIKFVSAVLDKFNDPDGESDLAPNAEMRTLMHELNVRLNAYFKADPMEEKSSKHKAA